MTYTVTFLDGKGAELSTFVDADNVSYDAHWVSFKRTVPPKAVDHSETCDNCGRLAVRPRIGSIAGSNIVAIYPAPRVRRVELSEEQV